MWLVQEYFTFSLCCAKKCNILVVNVFIVSNNIYYNNNVKLIGAGRRNYYFNIDDFGKFEEMAKKSAQTNDFVQIKESG